MQHPPETAVLTFENVEFDVVDLHNIPWLRGMQVAYALGYQNPRQDIKNLYDRNADEFTGEMT
ncbi:BRO-N domain-containing protein, partial [Ralstonia pseudosolanacearum]